MRLTEKKNRLFEIVESQHGIFTTKQAVEAGYDRKTHAYQVKSGYWIREHRGIYRLTHFQFSEEADFVIWSLWSRNRAEIPQGVYSHETALSILNLSDLNPPQLHLTVPKNFRRSSEIPDHLALHVGQIPPDETEEREGYRLTTALRAILDLSLEDRISRELIEQSIREALERGLITQRQRRLVPSLPFPEWTHPMFR